MSVLIQIDRLFYLPYFILRRVVTAFSSPPVASKGPVIVMKLMGMGSITRFSYLCDELKIDREKIILITFDKQSETCGVLGFNNAWFIRTSSIFVFLYDCLHVVQRTWQINPSYIIDFERCTYSVGTFRFILGWRTHAHLVCFEDRIKDDLQGRLMAYSNRVNLSSMLRCGIEKMPSTIITTKERVVEVQSRKIIVNCNASNYALARRYPKEYFIQLIELLHRHAPELEFYFTGSESEFAYVEEMVNRIEASKISVRNMAGRWKLVQLCRELADCRLFITCDSGPFHLAAALGVSTVAIWGPTQYEQFGYNDLSHIKNCTARLGCSPCLLHPHSPVGGACKGAITCMKDLPLGLVFQETMRFLAEGRSTRTVRLLPGMIDEREQVLNPALP